MTAAPETEETEEETEEETGDDKLPDDHPAVVALRKANKEAERYRKEAADAAKRAQKLEEQNQTEAEKAIAAAKAEGAAEASTTANARLIRAEAVATAAGVLRNPRLAPQLVDLSEITVDDDGEVDTKAIEKALADLVKAEPYLGADHKPSPGTGGGGARPAATTESMNDEIRRLAGRGD